MAIGGIGKRFPMQLVSNKIAGDFGIADTALITTGYTRIGRYTVKSGEIMQVGGGYAYVVLKSSTPTEIPAKIRIYAINSTESKKILLDEFHSTSTSDPADINKKRFIPPKLPRIAKDGYIQIEAMADTALTMDDANTIIQIPVLREDVALAGR